MTSGHGRCQDDVTGSDICCKLNFRNHIYRSIISLGTMSAFPGKTRSHGPTDKSTRRFLVVSPYVRNITIRNMKSITIEFCRDTPRLHLFRQSLHQTLVELAGEIRLIEDVDLISNFDRRTTEKPINDLSTRASPATPALPSIGGTDGYFVGPSAPVLARPNRPLAREQSVDRSNNNAS